MTDSRSRAEKVLDELEYLVTPAMESYCVCVDGGASAAAPTRVFGLGKFKE